MANSAVMSPTSSGTPLRLSMSRRSDRPDAESELQELLRQYRAVDSEKKSYTEKTQVTIKRQEEMVAKLTADNVILRQEIKNLENKRATLHQVAITPKLAELTDRTAMYNNKIDSELTNLENTDKEIKFMETRIREHQQLLGSGTLTNIDEQNRIRIKVLEDRLNNALSKYSDTLAGNKKLHDQIESCRREKQMYEGIFKKKEREIAQVKKKMASIVEESNYAYEARDDLQNKMISIKERQQKESAEFDAQVYELSRIIAQEEAKQRETERSISAMSGTTAYAEANRMNEEMQKKRKPLSDIDRAPSALGDLDSQVTLVVTEERLKSYEEVFVRLGQALNCSHEVEEVLAKFTEAEYRNFSLFNYVNEINNEAEKLEEEIKYIKGEIMQLSKQARRPTDQMRRNLLEGVMKQLEETEHKSEKFEKKFGDTTQIIQSASNGIQNLFVKLGCAPSSSNLDQALVSETNILDYLAQIEESMNSCISHYINIKTRENDNNAEDDASDDVYALPDAKNPKTPFNRTAALLGLNDTTITSLLAKNSLVAIDPPTTGIDSNDTEEENFPVASDDVKLKTLQMIISGVSPKDNARASRRSVGSARSKIRKSRP